MATAEVDRTGKTIELFHKHRTELSKIQQEAVKPIEEAFRFLYNAGEGAISVQRTVEPGLRIARQKVGTLFRLAASPDFFVHSSDTAGIDDRLRERFASAAESDNPQAGNRALSNPFIAVIGKTKAGKSSLINAFIGYINFLQQASHACTTRITAVSYGPKARFRLRYPTGNTSSWTDLGRNEAVRANVSGTDKYEKEKISTIVEAEVPSEFLKCGIDFLDSPGRDETTLLKNLTKSIFESFLPLLIYVIDGRDGLELPDEDDLRKVKQDYPHAQIFFVVTKCDKGQESRRPGGQVDEISLAKFQMGTIYQRLQDMYLLPSDLPMDRCNLFHGVSLMPNKLEDGGFFQDAFQRLRREIFQYVTNQLSHRVIDAAEAVKRTIEPIIDGCAQRSVTCTQQAATCLCAKHRSALLKAEQLKIKSEIEEAVYEKLKTIVTQDESEVKKSAKEVIQRCCFAFKENISTFTYPAETQLAMNSCRTMEEAHEIRQQCQRYLVDQCTLTLVTELRQYLEKCLTSTFQRVQTYLESVNETTFEIIDDFTKQTKEKRKGIEKTLHRLVMKDVLCGIVSAYKNPVDNILKSIQFMLLDKIRGFFHDLWKNIISIIRTCMEVVHLVQYANCADMVRQLKGDEWKKSQAELIIGKIDAPAISDDVFNITGAFLAEVHDEQKRQLSETTAVYEAYKNITERRNLDKITKQLADMYMELQCIVSQFQIQDVTILEPIPRPSSASGQGYSQVCRINKNEIVVMKQLADTFTLSDCSLALSMIMNVHYDHIQELIGLHRHQSLFISNTSSLRLFYRLRKLNCRQFLKSRTATLLSRVSVAHQVARALLYMHSQGIYHHNLKLENILFDDNQRAIVCDFNFATTMDISDNSDWHEAVDIQQFGAVLYDLVRNDPPPAPEKWIWPLSRPEEADDALWGLIKKCCEAKENNLPSILTIFEELTSWINEKQPSLEGVTSDSVSLSENF